MAKTMMVQSNPRNAIKQQFLKLLLLAALLLPMALPAQCEWVGGMGNWDDAGHWDCDGDDMGGGMGDYIPHAGATATILAGVVDLDVSPTVSALIMEGGELTGGAMDVLTATTGFVWKGGKISAKVEIPGGSSLDLITGGTKTLAGEIDLKPMAMAGWTAGTFAFDGGKFNIWPMSTFEIMTDAGITDAGAGGAIYNSGLINKSIGGGKTHFYVSFFNEPDGVLAMDAGEYDFHAPFFNDGEIITSFDRDITCHDDFFFTAGAIAGDIAGGGVLTVKDEITWTDGDVHYGATLRSEAGGLMRVAGTGAKGVSGTVEIFGDALWSASVIDLFSSGRWNIKAGAVMEVSFDGVMSKGDAGGGKLTNEGTFTKTGSSTTKTGIFEVAVENSGTFNVTSDTILIAGFLTNSGTINVPAGNYLRLGGGSEMNAGTTLLGTGDVDLVAGSHQFTTAISCSNDIGIAAELRLDGDLTNDTRVWMYDDCRITSTTGDGIDIVSDGVFWFDYGELEVDVTIGSAAIATIYTAGAKTLAADFTNYGHTEHYPGVSLTVNSPGSIANFGTYVFASSSDIGHSTVAGAFNNYGVVDFEGASTTTSVTSAFTNDSLIIGEGVFNPLGSFTNTVNANMSPGHSPGILTIDHDFVNGDTLIIEINDNTGPGSGHDQLLVTGKATLSGTLEVRETGTVSDGSFTVLACQGTPSCLSGDFAAAVLPPGYTYLLTATEVIVTRSALPVEWLLFEAAAREGGVELHWQTATETNNDHFVVERSLDGRTFQAIATVPGQGNSSAAQAYQFRDRDLPPTAQTLYYRLRQVDFDGAYGFSPIRTAHPHPESGRLIKASYQTREGSIAVVLSRASSVEVTHLELYRVDGIRLGVSKDVAGGEVHYLDRPNLAAGIYILLATDGHRRDVRRVVVR